MMAGQDLNIAVIGVGGRGQLAGYAHKPGCGSRIVAGADVSDAQLATFTKKYGNVKSTKDYRELLADKNIDAVFVTSPDFFHERQATDALRVGKAVYLEKPMAITLDGCDRILAAARETGAKLYVGHNLRHLKTLRKMKELIDLGRIGNVKAIWCRHFISYGGEAYFKDWHSERDKATGLLLQKGAHDIDVIHWLGGGSSVRVHAFGGLTVYGDVKDRRAENEPPRIKAYPNVWPPLNQRGLSPHIDIEDLSMMQMQLGNGVFASYVQCHYTPDAWRNYCIIGDEGRIENFGDFTGNVEVKLWYHPPYYNPDGDETFHIDLNDAGTHGGADPRIVEEFVRYVRDGDKIAISPVAARDSVAAGYIATMSLRNGGQTMNVPQVSDEIREYFAKDVY